jgi:hypothetical protein
MLNQEELNRALVTIVEKRMELGRLKYNDVNYDILEDAIHVAEDEFVAQFGKEMEEVLKHLHAQYCPQTEVLSPISYLAQHYIKVGKFENGTAKYEVANPQQGLMIENSEWKDPRIVLLPNPVRLVLIADEGEVYKEIWKL